METVAAWKNALAKPRYTWLVEKLTKTSMNSGTVSGTVC